MGVFQIAWTYYRLSIASLRVIASNMIAVVMFTSANQLIPS